ncbi:hypothetical protein F5H01DRAFT_385410 [Linnemannia elongata]|nr:hypothetical protein F5H01DRAFT_385410 [Linnemannia elongata]
MVFDADLPEDTIHVIVQRPLPVAKRDREEDAGPSSSRKRHRPHTLKDAIEEAGLTEKAVVDDQLHGANIKDMDKISAPRGILLPVVVQTIYVREAYKDLYDIISTFENNRPALYCQIRQYRDFKPFLSLPDTWYFVDSTPDPVLGRAKTVISASPKTLFPKPTIRM